MFIDPNTSASASLYRQRLAWQSRNPCKEQTESLEKCLSEFEVLIYFQKEYFSLFVMRCYFTFVHSFIHLFIISFIYSFIFQFIFQFIHPFIHSFIVLFIQMQWWNRLAIHKTHLDMIREIPFNVTFVLFQHSPSKDVLYGGVMDKVHTTNAANNKNKKPSQYFTYLFT